MTDPKNPEHFDFDAFLAGFEPAKDVDVTLYPVDLSDQIREHDDAAAVAHYAGDEKAAKAEAKKAQAARDKMEKGKVTFTLSPITPDDWRAVVSIESTTGDVTEARALQLSKQVVAINGDRSKTMTVEQWKALLPRLRLADFNTLASEAIQQMAAEVVLPDFSQVTSDLLAEGKSS